MDVTADSLAPAGRDPSPGLEPGAVTEAEVQRLAETFAVTPDAARLAVTRVGSNFRDLQRELGGRR